jgi:hypothetical protein
MQENEDVQIHLVDDMPTHKQIVVEVLHRGPNLAASII